MRKILKNREIYRVDLNIIKKTIKICDTNIKEINKKIDKKNKIKQKGGVFDENNCFEGITENDILYMLIPKNE
jgi:hypothetical protein